MGAIADWWGSLSLFLQVYWVAAVPFTLILLFQFINVMVEAGAVEADADSGSLFIQKRGRLFSFKNASGFLAALGWVGIVCTEAGLPAVASLALAIAGGVIMMTLVWSLHKLLTPLPEDELTWDDFSSTGEVLNTIEARRGNVGKVRVKTRKVFRTLDAVTDDAEPAKPGQTVTLVKIFANTILLVTRK